MGSGVLVSYSERISELVIKTFERVCCRNVKGPRWRKRTWRCFVVESRWRLSSDWVESKPHLTNQDAFDLETPPSECTLQPSRGAFLTWPYQHFVCWR